MISPAIKLREGFNTLLSALTYTKSDGSTPVALYLERYPGFRARYPYVRYLNAIITPNNAKNCIGWNALVFIETVTGFQVGHGDFSFADELEQQIIDLVLSSPLQLSVSPEYSLEGINLEQSEYFEEFVSLDPAKKDSPETYIIRKITQFEVLIEEL